MTEQTKIPRFIELDGCINCETYQSYKPKPRFDVAGIRKIQLHEALVPCIFLGCDSHGYNVLSPYFGDHELEYIIQNKAFPSGKTVTDEALEKAKQMLESRNKHKRRIT